MPVPTLDWMVGDAQGLADCRHDHPFAVLGPHDAHMPGISLGQSALVRKAVVKVRVD